MEKPREYMERVAPKTSKILKDEELFDIVCMMLEGYALHYYVDELKTE